MAKLLSLVLATAIWFLIKAHLEETGSTPQRKVTDEEIREAPRGIVVEPPPRP